MLGLLNIIFIHIKAKEYSQELEEGGRKILKWILTN
jgi:hypothetical protein